MPVRYGMLVDCLVPGAAGCLSSYPCHAILTNLDNTKSVIHLLICEHSIKDCFVEAEISSFPLSRVQDTISNTKEQATQM